MPKAKDNAPLNKETLASSDNKTKQFLAYWLSKREKPLVANIRTFDALHSPKDAPLDYSSQRFQIELGRQLDAMNKAGIAISNKLPNHLRGEFDKGKGVISLNERLNPDLIDKTIVHERSHSLKPYPQEAAIKKLMEDHRVYPSEDEQGKYLDQPGEIYSRMMMFRQANGLKPEQEVTKDDLKQWKGGLFKDELSRYPTKFLLDLFNLIALNQNQSQDNNNLT